MSSFRVTAGKGPDSSDTRCDLGIMIRRHSFSPDLGSKCLCRNRGKNCLAEGSRCVSPTVTPWLATENAPKRSH